MTIDLPPRRTLPDHVKERMRPTLTEAPQRSRRNLPFAVAAGVGLLVAASALATDQAEDVPVEPANDRVLTPTSVDVDRCRTARNDPNWNATAMVTFEGTKVLVGDKNTFCELSRSWANVVRPAADPLTQPGGNIAHASAKIIAGTPPLGTVNARARTVGEGYSRGSRDSVVTSRFFVIYSPDAVPTQVLFDDTTIQIAGTGLPQTTQTESYQSGDRDPWQPQNVLDRCLDNTQALQSPTGWKPLAHVGLTEHEGLITAKSDDNEWGSCAFRPSTGPETFTPQGQAPDKPERVTVLSIHPGTRGLLVAGRANLAATTVEMAIEGQQPASTTPDDGYFAITVPSGGTTHTPARINVILRAADNSVLYEGPLW